MSFSTITIRGLKLNVPTGSKQEAMLREIKPMIDNPIRLNPMAIAATPESWAQIEAWVMLHNEADRVHLFTAAYMAWNLAASIVDSKNKK